MPLGDGLVLSRPSLHTKMTGCRACRPDSIGPQMALRAAHSGGPGWPPKRSHPQVGPSSPARPAWGIEDFRGELQIPTDSPSKQSHHRSSLTIEASCELVSSARRRGEGMSEPLRPGRTDWAPNPGECPQNVGKSGPPPSKPAMRNRRDRRSGHLHMDPHLGARSPSFPQKVGRETH